MVLNCKHCSQKILNKNMWDHYTTCLYEKYKHRTGSLVSFSSHGITGHPYYIFAIVGSKCKLSDIDKFLRDVWCECCGHLSGFVDQENNPLKDSSLVQKLGEDFNFLYSYDSGSTTDVFSTCIKHLEGVDKLNNKIEILIQNDKPKIKCKSCKTLATNYYEDIPLCETHSNDTNIVKEDDYLLPIVNSPRSGVCGYAAE